MLKSFNELRESKSISLKTLVVAAAHDRHTLEAVYEARDELGIGCVLVGDRERILTITSELGFSVDKDDVVDAAHDEECVQKAVSLINNGSGDALMKGIVDTGTLLRAVLDGESGIRGSGTLSHLAMLEVPTYHKLIGVTDGGMIPNPTLSQKADIVKNAVSFYKRIGYKKPKVAALCSSENENPKILETVEAAKLHELCREGKLGDCVLEGPLSFDIAVCRESADLKGFKSEISGETDILLVPNITVGNVLAKGLIYWAGAKMAGCILGARAPIVLTSRGASSEEKLLSIMLSIMH